MTNKDAPLFGRASFFLVFFFLFNASVFIVHIPVGLCQQLPPTLQEGINQYNEGNYEEAIEVLQKVRAQEPTSSLAAFFLGLAYKQTQDFEKALPHLRDAVTLTPKIKEALVELIDTLYQVGRTEEAKQWLKVAEEEGIFPARISFLKGLILARENRNQEAIEAFEKAKKLDPTVVQAADFQIAMLYLKERKLDKAKERLKVVITRDPLSDLSSYARQYHDLVEQRMYMERPLRLTLGVFAGYDTNIVTKPTNDIVAGDITDEEGGILQSYARLDFVPTFEGPWLFNASYSAASTVNQKHTHSHDFFAQTFTVSPGLSLGRVALIFDVSYTNALLRTDPDLYPTPESNPGYKRYLDNVMYGPRVRFLLNQNHILDVFAGYDRKDFYNQKKTTTRTDSFFENNRDAAGPRIYVSWIWLFAQNSFFNLRYDYTRDYADGMYWDNEGNRLSANFSIPLLSEKTAKRYGPLSLQLSGSYFHQWYTYEQPYQENDGSVRWGNRKDESFNWSAGLTWEFYRNMSFIVQYMGTNCNSKIPAYDYHRNVYSTGFEFRF